MEKNDSIESAINAISAMSAKSNNSAKVSSFDYSKIFDFVQSGALSEKTANLQSYNFLYANIKKMQKNDFCNMKSDEPEKKKIRRFIQNLGKGQSLTPENRKKMQIDFWTAIEKLHQMLIKK